jgi:NADH:ubiquinone oxidoreductase subunit 6 (subunit J)
MSPNLCWFRIYLILFPAMFVDFLLPFEIASILLLVAIVGAVILSKREV